MSCIKAKNVSCGCKFNIKSLGQCDVSKITISGRDRTMLNWSEISVPEMLSVPPEKPNIEHLDQVHVNAVIQNTKLIETPFSYRSYEREATAFEITTVTAAINLAATIDLSPVITAINAILSVPGLPAIPQVAAVTAALNAVTAAGASLTTVIDEALDALAGDCIVASLLVTLVQSILAAVGVLNLAIQALLAAINALAAVTAGIPIIGPLVAAAVALAVTAVNTVLGLITEVVTALTESIVLIGNTSVLVIQPNEEGTCLSGRKLIVEGILEQKVVYTALVSSQSVHSVCKTVPFSAYIIPYANFQGLTYSQNITVITDPDTCTSEVVNGFLYDPQIPPEVELCEEFEVNVCVEDIFAYDIDLRNIFKNTTLFLWAKPTAGCQ